MFSILPKDTLTGGARDRTTDLLIGRLSALITQLQPQQNPRKLSDIFDYIYPKTEKKNNYCVSGNIVDRVLFV